MSGASRGGAGSRHAPQVLLDRTPRPAAAPPALDPAQQQVVDHRTGPLLVLAGPGTGKTTTLVEAMIARLADLPAAGLLGLTFGRRAAQEWRERVAARAPAGALPDVLTFHSFAYGLVRQFAGADQFEGRPLVASSPDQLRRIRELLAEPVADLGWPEEWGPALRTQGFAEAVQDVVVRARTYGLSPLDVIELGRSTAEPTWAAVGRFLEEYLDVVAAEGVLDYAELVVRARSLLAEPEVLRLVRERYRAVFVDEYQDTDVAAQELLRDVVGPGTSLVVVGDPDQSIYAFRGAHREGILQFPLRFAVAPDRPAPTVVLDRSRRFGPVVQAAARRILRDAMIPGLKVSDVERHRSPRCDPDLPGSVEVLTFDSEGAEASHIAESLRRAHLSGVADGEPVPWHEMAVLVRSGVRTIPVLRRALAVAGVPVEVAGDEVALREDPAVAALLQALALSSRVEQAGIDDVVELLLGPLGHVDPNDLRALRRELRRETRAASGGDVPLPPSSELLLQAFLAPAEVALHDGPAASAIRKLRAALDSAAAARSRGPQAALWELWSATGWPERLEAESLAGGARGRRADRDLDAVCALFDLAARADERAAGHKGVEVFLHDVAAQEIPAVPGSAAPVRDRGVRLLTAHRAKGLEWRYVVVAGVQERAWPDLRRRGSLLSAETLVEPEGPPGASEVLAEERRLMFVACTRAKEHLLVTAVAGGSGDVAPSRFLDELAGPPDASERPAGVSRGHVSGRPSRGSTLSGLVASLRSAAEHGSPALRAAAVQRLAGLADELDPAGRPLVPAADPAGWWGVRELTASPVPVRPAEHAVALSASQVESFRTCPLQWFLTHEAGGSVASSTAMGFGSLIHAVAAGVVKSELPADPDVIGEVLDRWWGQLSYEAPWQAAAERAAASDAVAAFLRWHDAQPARTPLAAEAGFDVELEVGGDRVALRGSIDRLDLDSEGRAVVVDYKTGKSVPTKEQTADNVQLALYQLVVAERAVEGVELPGGPGGAELVYLRKTIGGGMPSVRAQAPLAAEAPADAPPPLASREGVLVELELTTSGIRAESFPARPDPANCARCDVRVSCSAVEYGTEVDT